MSRRTRGTRGLITSLAAVSLLAVPLAATATTDASPEAEREARRAEGHANAVTAEPGFVIAGTPGTALEIANAIAAPGTTVSGAAFDHLPSDPNINAGTSTALAGFPTNGTTFGVLSTGTLADIPVPGGFADTTLGGGPVRGNTDRDVTVLAIDLAVPTGANCLSFDFKFLSEEYPRFVNSSYNDAFIAELNESTWTTSGSVITAPNNFAFDDSGEVVSINSTGIGGMTPAQGAGTTFDGDLTEDGNTDGAATVRLSASSEVNPGANTLYLSIFDQGDAALDSAVFLDNLRIGYAANPGVDCVPGAIVVDYELDLEPPVGTAPVGGSHTVTAELTTSDGEIVPEADIEFTVSGANPATGVEVTDLAGVATFSYPGTTAGTDTISACYRPDPEAACAATGSASFTWTQTDRVVERLGGPDRYGTAAEIAAAGDWGGGAEVVYIATGVNFPDALSVSALAGQLESPVLLTRPTSLPDDTRAALTALAPERIVVVGGPDAVSDGVLTALSDYATADTDAVTRLAGPHRYGTSLAVALEFEPGVEVAYVATGADFPDALAGAARAGQIDAPIVLTQPGRLPAATIAALEHLNPASIVVLGSDEAVSDTVFAALAEYTDGTVTRVDGAQRYQTAVAISQLFDPPPTVVFISTGWTFPDALTGGPLATELEGVVLLTKPHVLPQHTIEELERLNPERIIVLGETPAVSLEVEIALAEYLAP